MQKRTKSVSHKAVEPPSDAELSDFEKGNGNASSAPTPKFSQKYFQFSQSMPSMSDMLTKGHKYGSVPLGEDLLTDDEAVQSFSVDEFAADEITRLRSLKTGRQRKKLAARSKGSEFRANRKKKRVYFCCISSEIDVEKMEDELVADPTCFGRWKYKVYTDVLHLYRNEVDTGPSANIAINTKTTVTSTGTGVNAADDVPRFNSYEAKFLTEDFVKKERAYSATSDIEGYTSYAEEVHATSKESAFRISNAGAQEIFIFDFGALVFWGVPRGEDASLLKIIRRYASKGIVGPEEFSNGEDDMAFISSMDALKISIQNDVIELPWDSDPKQRLSVSFAIAQSSVLAIFEARIERKVDEYKYIPEALAAHGKIHLTELQLGMMIGEVFVIRHDVNLHTEILGETGVLVKRAACGCCYVFSLWCL
jgi:uncharacterized Rmd1/YagE family protein